MSSKTSLSAATLILAATLLAGGKAAADQVIPDDLIVQGSICTGFDCVNNEVFNDNTIILKENQLRILFLDTSVGSFPSNDWRLVANDATGSGNLFAIEDATAGRRPFTVTAGASANSIFVDSTGRVGFRTSTPVLDLHVNTSNTPAIRLEQNNSGGFTAQTWDIGANEANFFVRDVTGGSRLPFRVRPGAPTSSLDISADGDVGIGTASPGFKLDVSQASADTALRINATTANRISRLFLTTTTRDWRIVNDPTIGDRLAFFDNNAGAIRMAIDTSGNVGINTTAPAAKLDVNGGTVRVGTPGNAPGGNAVCFSNPNNLLGNCSSDGRLKRDIHYLDDGAGLSALMRLKPVTFRWHDGDDRLMAGFVAQDTRAAIPEAVYVPAAGDGHLALDTSAVLSYAVKATQELARTVESLKADNERLRAEVRDAKAKP